MYCRNCGKEINDEIDICPYCGKRQSSQINFSRENKSEDASSFGWAFLGFLIPLLGLILYLVWKPEYPLRAKSLGKGALVSVIASIIASIVLSLIMTIALPSCLYAYYY